MSVKSEIERIQGNIAAAFSKVAAKGGSVPAAKTSANLASAIGSIQTGTDTSDATAAAGDILSGKTAYVRGAKVTGTIASKGASDLTASGATVSVPAGFYPSAASKSVATATQATPGISVSSGGLITASATQGAGYVSAGTKSATRQLTTQGSKTVIPGTAAQTAVASGVYTTGAVQVAGDSNLRPWNIAENVNIFGVSGTYLGLPAYDEPIAVYGQLTAGILKLDIPSGTKFITAAAFGLTCAYIYPDRKGTIDAKNWPRNFCLLVKGCDGEWYGMANRTETAHESSDVELSFGWVNWIISSDDGTQMAIEFAIDPIAACNDSNDFEVCCYV